MKHFARMVNGLMAEHIPPLVIDGVEVPIEERFHPDVVAQLVEVDPLQLPPTEAPKDTAPVVPQEVTMQQARRALHAAGKLAAVESAIDAMAEPERTDARIQWEYSGVVRRNQPLVLQLAPALGLSDAALDALFTQAAQV